MENGIYQRGRIVSYQVQASDGFDLDNIDSIDLVVAAENVWQNSLSKQTTIYWKFYSQDTLFAAEVTGVKENEKKIFLHPPRSGKFIFAELAPFPDISTRAEKGAWSIGYTLIPAGYGDFSGSKIDTYDTVINKIIIQDGIAAGDSVWLINGCTPKSPIGKIRTAFYFHDKYGFVKMIYNLVDSNQSVSITAVSSQGFQ